MLNKIILNVSIITFFVSAGFAQPTFDYNEKEFFVGYSHQRGEQSSFNGIEVSAVRNFTRYFGIKGDFSAARHEDTFTASVNSGGVTTTFPVRGNEQIYNFLGGIQVKDNAAGGRLKPFAHALIGVGYRRYENRVENCPASLCGNLINPKDSSAGLAGAFGGGLDIRVNNKIDLRLIQVDYNPIRLYHRTEHRARFGFGIVFR